VKSTGKQNCCVAAKVAPSGEQE